MRLELLESILRFTRFNFLRKVFDLDLQYCLCENPLGFLQSILLLYFNDHFLLDRVGILSNKKFYTFNKTHNSCMKS